MRNSTIYKIAGTKTFRLASGKMFGKWGSNLQNVEKSMRKIYIPDDGYKFGQRDQSGAEALIVAYLCEAGSFRELFIHGVKPHVYVALHLFKDVWQRKMREHNVSSGSIEVDINELCNTPISQLKLNPFWRDLDLLIKDSDNWSINERYYYLAKQTCHSSNYGIMPPTFRMNVLEKSDGKIVLTKEESEKFISFYNGLFPEIQNWHRRVRQHAEQYRVLCNLHGHPYQLTQYEFLDSKWKELYAWVPQSTVGEITRIAYMKMQEYIEANNKKWDMLQDNHDSFLTQFPDDLEEEREWLLVSAACLEQEFTSPTDGIKFKMKSEASTGFNWSPYKKEINEFGLREIK